VSASAPHGTVWHEWPGSSLLRWNRGMATAGTAVRASIGSGHHCHPSSRRSVTVPTCERGSLVTHFNASPARCWRRRTVVAGSACTSSSAAYQLFWRLLVSRYNLISGGAGQGGSAAPVRVVTAENRHVCGGRRCGPGPLRGSAGPLRSGAVAVTIKRGGTLCVRHRPQRRCQTASTDRTGLIS
jgi:hypothetical protein